jgi:hypothetical protein
VRKVEVMGIVVAVDRKERYLRFTGRIVITNITCFCVSLQKVDHQEINIEGCEALLNKMVFVSCVSG